MAAESVEDGVLTAKTSINFQFPARKKLVSVMDDESKAVFENEALLLLRDELAVQHESGYNADFLKIISIDNFYVKSQSTVVQGNMDDSSSSSSLLVSTSVEGSYRYDKDIESNTDAYLDAVREGNQVLDDFVDGTFSERINDFTESLQTGSSYLANLVSPQSYSLNSNNGESNSSNDDVLVSSSFIVILVSIICGTVIILTVLILFAFNRKEAFKFEDFHSSSSCGVDSGKTWKAKKLEMKNLTYDLESGGSLASMLSHAEKHCSRSVESASMLPLSVLNENKEKKQVDVNDDNLEPGSAYLICESDEVEVKDDKIRSKDSTSNSDASTYDYYESRMNVTAEDAVRHSTITFVS